MIKTFVLITTFIISLNCFSQDTTSVFNMNLHQLLNIKIYSSNKKTERLLETPAVVNVITSEDIRMLNFNTLEQVLEYSVGLASLNGEGNVFTTTTIRGNTLVNYNTNTLLLFDGIPLYNAYHGSFDFQIIPLSSIERIEIVKGANSVLYGSNAINGVINIISKTSRYQDSTTVSGRMRYGSFGTTYTNGSLLSKKENWRFSLFADIINSAGEVLPFVDEQGKTLDLKKTYKGLSTVVQIGYKKITFNIHYYNRCLPGVRTRNFPVVYSSLTNPDSTIRPENSNEFSYVANLSYATHLSEKTKLSVRSDVMTWEMKKDLTMSYWDYSSFGIYNDIYVEVKSNDKLLNKIGVNYNHYLGRRYKSEKEAYDIGKDKIWTNDFSFYLNGEYKLLKSVAFYYGGRFYYAKYNESNFSNFSPRIALTYTPAKNLYLKAIYGQSFRIPTYFEKEVSSNSIIGNPNLLPEKSTSYDFVISGILNKLQFDIDFYHTLIKDKITRVTSADDPNMKINLNVGEISLYGIEFNSKYRISDKLYGFLGYAYSDGKDVETNDKPQYIFHNMINMGANLKLRKWLTINTSAKFMDKWGEASAYILLNVGAYIKPCSKLPLYIDLKVDNMLDTDVYLPEIARESERVPVIPKTLNRMFFVGFSYNL